MAILGVLLAEVVCPVWFVIWVMMDGEEDE